MLPEKYKEVNIDVDSDIITHKTAAKILTALIEFLTFQRHQIPFTFETFKFMVNKIRPTIESDAENWNNVLLDKQRLLAANTLDAICELKKNLTENFERYEISSAIIAFGPTPMTAKEAFLLKYPRISRNHSPENHSESQIKIVNNTMMSILTNKELIKTLSSQMNPTNMHLLIKIKNLVADLNSFQSMEHFRLPGNCKTSVINLSKSNYFVDNTIPLNCCKEITIFEDFENLNLSTPPSLNIFTDNSQEPCDINTDIWYESLVVVKGYKDVLVKGKKIWDF